jgi:hypothetical protein
MMGDKTPSSFLGVSTKPEENFNTETHLKLNASSQRHIRLMGAPEPGNKFLRVLVFGF